MHRFLALFLAALMLLQTLGQEVLVVDYQLHKSRITELYCVNKARPQLHCNGKCHLARQLRKAASGDKKTPAAALARVKYEVLPTAALLLPLRQQWPQTPQRYPSLRVVHCVVVTGQGVFRPPIVVG